MRPAACHLVSCQRGFGIVELMIAMTVSLVLLGGAIAVVSGSKLTYFENDRVARLQESGRAAFELLLRDLRGAGFPGCAQPLAGVVNFNNALNDADTLPWNFSEALQGFEATGVGWTPALDAALIPDALPGSDIIVVRTGRANAPEFRTSAITNPNDPIVVTKGAADQLAAGTAVVINDCASMSVFNVSAFDDGGATATISHAVTAPGGGMTPSNVTADLGATFAAGALVAPVAAVIYYIRPSATGGGPALWRIVSGSGAEELVEGVEALQLLYGRDTNHDAVIEDYVTADAVTDWNAVINVQVSLLVRSLDPNSPDLDTATYDMLGTIVGPFDDRYQRTLVTATVNLRNRTS